MAKRKKKEVAAPAQVYYLEILGRRYPVEDARQASYIVSRIRDSSGTGASEFGDKFRVFDASGTEVAYVSYNGKVWKPMGTGRWQDDPLVYDPFAEGEFAGEPKKAEFRVLSGFTGEDWESWDSEYAKGFEEGLDLIEADREAALEWWRAHQMTFETPPSEAGKSDAVAQFWVDLHEGGMAGAPPSAYRRGAALGEVPVFLRLRLRAVDNHGVDHEAVLERAERGKTKKPDWILKILGTPGQWYLSSLVDSLGNFPEQIWLDFGGKWYVENFGDIVADALDLSERAVRSA